MTTPVIKAEKLTKRYGKSTVLDSISFSVPKNSICGFLGPNGAGKTTTIKLLLGLIKPTQGEGNVLGYDIKDDSIQIRKRIGYLSQNPKFYDHMTPLEILKFTSTFFDRQESVEEYLDLVELSKKRNEKVGHFSGGEKQRLGLAQAMVGKPELLILDEPAAALDPLGRYKVLEIMKTLKKDTTIFFSTHILNDVQSISDYLVILEKGKVISQGDSNELINGKDSYIYEVKGDGFKKGIKGVLGKYEWVDGVEMEGNLLKISVNDTDRGDRDLLRTLLKDKGVVIKRFARIENSLESVFINLVNSKKDVK